MTQQYRNVNISEEQAHVYYALLMCSDPYPGGETDKLISNDTADTIARYFGFVNWVEHYHALENNKGAAE